MNNRDIGIGGSAGAAQPLKQIPGGLPTDLLYCPAHSRPGYRHPGDRRRRRDHDVHESWSDLRYFREGLRGDARQTDQQVAGQRPRDAIATLLHVNTQRFH